MLRQLRVVWCSIDVSEGVRTQITIISSRTLQITKLSGSVSPRRVHLPSLSMCNKCRGIVVAQIVNATGPVASGLSQCMATRSIAFRASQVVTRRYSGGSSQQFRLAAVASLILTAAMLPLLSVNHGTHGYDSLNAAPCFVLLATFLSQTRKLGQRVYFS